MSWIFAFSKFYAFPIVSNKILQCSIVQIFFYFLFFVLLQHVSNLMYHVVLQYVGIFEMCSNSKIRNFETFCNTTKCREHQGVRKNRISKCSFRECEKIRDLQKFSDFFDNARNTSKFWKFNETFCKIATWKKKEYRKIQNRRMFRILICANMQLHWNSNIRNTWQHYRMQEAQRIPKKRRMQHLSKPNFSKIRKNEKELKNPKHLWIPQNSKSIRNLEEFRKLQKYSKYNFCQRRRCKKSKGVPTSAKCRSFRYPIWKNTKN